MTRDADNQMQAAIQAHLARWGLRRFARDETYFSWQRESLSPLEIEDLHRHVEAKRIGTAAAEAAFYDLTAQPRILPILYSQRYEYYCALAPLIAARLGDVRTVLDFGCGVGILTTFYAQQCPDVTFVGIDRSEASIASAQDHAGAWGLKNVRFDCVDVAELRPSERFDVIVATHALVQAEQDPGLPSRSWSTFERDREPAAQRAFEARTGIGPRLDRLSESLASQGRMLVFEKVRQLARRVPFQRALAARGLGVTSKAVPVRYRTVEEVTDDGPLFHLQRGVQGMPWDESPEPDEGAPFNRIALQTLSPNPEAPLYENHWPSAQGVWEQMRDRAVMEEMTRREPDGRQLHAEMGTAEGLPYLYIANTFDQRQLLLMHQDQRAALESYYREIEGKSARG